MTEAKLEHRAEGYTKEEPGNERWLMLAIVLVVQGTLQAGLQATSPLAPFLQNDLQISRAQVGLLGSAMSVGTIVVVLYAGVLADRFGAYLLLAGGTIAMGLFLFLASLASSYWLMAGWMLLAGVGVGLTSTAASKAVMVWFTARTRGTAMGIKQTGTTMGGAAVALILPAIALATDWRYALALTGVAVAVAGLVSLLVYRDFKPAVRPARATAQRGLLSALRKRNIKFAWLATFCFTGVQMTLSTYLVLYFTEVRAMEVTAAGLLLAVAQVGGMAGRVLFGIISDRFLDARRKGLLIFVGAGSAVAGLITAATGGFLPFPALVVLVLVYGFLALGWTGLFMIMISELAGKDSAGQGAAAGLLGGSTGYFIVPPLFGLMVDVSHSYPLALTAIAFISGLAVLALCGVRERAQ